MARINAEEQWWTDPRRSLLIRLIGNEDEADGASIKMWRLAQTFWVSGRKLVPVDIFQSMAQSENLMKAGLASIEGDMVYVRGSSAYLDWIIEQREIAKANGSKGGKKSAQRPRNKKGHFYPAVVDPETKPESKPCPSETQANPSKPKLSYSCSYSGFKDEEGKSPSAAENFESRFHPDAVKIREGLKLLKLDQSCRQNLPQIIAHFEGYERFKVWANGLHNAAKDKHFELEGEKIRYFTAALKKEIGVLK